MSSEFGRPLPTAEMRLKCCSTQVLDCKGVYCPAHNAAVPSGIRDSESVGPGRTRIRPDMAAGQTRLRLSWHLESSPNQLRRPRQRRPPRWLRRAHIVLVILAAGAGVAFGGGGARAGGSADYNTQNKPSRRCTCQAWCTNGLLNKSSCLIRVSRSIEWCRMPIFSA
jgi:hypothetical protein